MKLCIIQCQTANINLFQENYQTAEIHYMWLLITCHSPHWNNPFFITRTVTEFWVPSLALDWLRAKILSNSWLKSKSFNSNYFCTDLRSNFWKIAKLLRKIKNTVSLRFISLSFPSKTSSSKRTRAYWQWIVCTMKKGNDRYLWSGGVALKCSSL